MEPIIDKEPTLVRMLKKTINQKITEESSNDCNDEKKNDEEIVIKPKTIKRLVADISSEFILLIDLILGTGYTGLDENYKIRQKLNLLIYDIRKAQDVMIKIKSSNKNKNKKD
jgi:hypothetical protein